MGGKRVFEFAKEFKISSKEMIEELKKLGIEVSSHMAVLDEKAIGRLRGGFHKEEKIGKKEDLLDVSAPAGAGQETVPTAGSPRVSKEVVKKAPPPVVAEKKGAKEQKKKGIKVIIAEPEEDLRISQRWKRFKAIPKKEKRSRPGARLKLTRTDQSVEITKPRKKMIKLYEGTTVKEFADLIGQKSSEVIAKLIGMGMMVTINQPVDIDAALLVADSYGLKVEVAAEKKREEYMQR